jgi:hypothetical protein
VRDVLSFAENEQFRIHWSDGSRSEPGDLGIPNEPVIGAGLESVSLESGAGPALLVSDCYACRFENLYIVRSRRLVGLQATRNSVVDGVTGHFSERGIEVAMFATDNVIRNVDGVVAENPLPRRPVIRFGEFASRNTIENARFTLGEAYRGRREKIRFDNSSANKLRNVRLDVTTYDGRKLVYSSRPDTFYDLKNVRICEKVLCWEE